MDAEERDAKFWETHCWKRRFYGEPCEKPATWRGPQSTSAFVEAWRACDEHRTTMDVPLVVALPERKDAP